jgi:hypothetical protein
VISAVRIERLRAAYPEFAQGEADARARTWREIRGHSQSMAYEIGSFLALIEMKRTDLSLLRLPKNVERAIRYLENAMATPTDEMTAIHLMAKAMIKRPEMVQRIAHALDPDVFLFDRKDSVSRELEILTTIDAAPLIFMARQQAAYMKAITIIAVLREPTALMVARGETRWRELVDLLIKEDPEDQQCSK